MYVVIVVAIGEDCTAQKFAIQLYTVNFKLPYMFILLLIANLSLSKLLYIHDTFNTSDCHRSVSGDKININYLLTILATEKSGRFVCLEYSIQIAK